MGAEMAQVPEWNHDAELEWHLMDVPAHRGVWDFVRALNHVYRAERALHAVDFEPQGFEWMDCSDAEAGVVGFVRRAAPGEGAAQVLCVFNCTPVAREGYRLGVPAPGFWREVLNSDAGEYGGTGRGNLGGLVAEPVTAHGRAHSLAIHLPPLGALYFRHEG